MEVAIVLPVAFMFMFALFDVGRAITTKQLMVNATRAAVRQAVVGTTTLTTSDIQATVTSGMGSFALQGMNVQVYLDESCKRTVHCSPSNRQLCPNCPAFQPAAKSDSDELKSNDE